MAASPVLLLAVAHTLVLSLLPFLLLHLPRLVRARHPIDVSLISSSTLCIGLYGVASIIALAGSGAQGGRVASLVAGTMGCAGILLLDISLVLCMHQDGRDESSRSHSRFRSDRLAMVIVLIALTVAGAALHVTLLCLSLPHSTALALSVGRAVLHIVFLILLLLVLLLSIGTLRCNDSRHQLEESSQGCVPVSARATSTAGAWYPSPSAEVPDLLRIGVVQAGVILAHSLGIVLDVVSLAFPIRENYSALAEGGRTTPTLFGATSSPAAYVVVGCLTFFRWALTISIIPSKPTQHHVAPSDRTDVLPDSAGPQHTQHPHSFTSETSSNSWVDLAPSPVSATQHSDPPLAEVPAEPRIISAPHPHALPYEASGQARAHKIATYSCFPSLGMAGGGAEHRPNALELEHPYMRIQTFRATFSPSIQGSDAGEYDRDRSEDIVIPPSPTPLPGGRRRAGVSPSLPTTYSPKQPEIPHRFRHSLPPELTIEASLRPLPPLGTDQGPSQSGAQAGHDRGTTSPFKTLPRLARRISHSFTSPYSPGGPSSPYRFPQKRSPRISPVPSLAHAHLPRDHNPSVQLLTQSSQHHRRTMTSPSDLRTPFQRPTIPRFSTVPDLRSSRAESPAPASSLSLSSQKRRRSGSIGSLLRSVAAVSGASGRNSTTPTPAAENSWWDIEPNESEDDPFARSAPQSISSTSLRPARSTASLRTARSNLDVADEAMKLRRALDAIHEPATGSRESSAEHSHYCSASTASEEQHEPFERVVTPAPSRASFEEAGLGPQVHRQRSISGSLFREHLDLSHSHSSTNSLSSPTGLPVSGFAEAGAHVPGLWAAVTPLRQRTDRKASMSPTALRGPRWNDPLDPNKINDEDSSELSVEIGHEDVEYQRDLAPALVLRGSESPFPHKPTTRHRLSLEPIVPFTVRSTISRRSSLIGRVKRTTSSPSLFATAAFRKLRRHSPSPLPLDDMRQSESSDLSFACRGQSTSGSDHDVRAVRTVFGASASGSSRDVFTPVRADETRTSRSIVERRPWWNRLPGSRSSTPYLRSSVSSMLPRGSNSSYGLGLRRSISLSSSALPGQHNSLDDLSSTSSARVRSNSLPLLSGRDLVTCSQLKLPPVRDVSPFGSSIFGPCEPEGSEEGRAEPFPARPASLAPAQYLLPIDPGALRASFLSVGSSVPSRTSSSVRRNAEIRHEDVVHELDDLVGSLGATFVGHSDGHFEFPERSFSCGTSSSCSMGGELPFGSHQTAQLEDAEQDKEAISPTAFATSPTCSASLASSTPLSALFSPLDLDGVWQPRLGRTGAFDGPGSEADEPYSPLTPATRWGSFSDTGSVAGADGIRRGWWLRPEVQKSVAHEDATEYVDRLVVDA